MIDQVTQNWALLLPVVVINTLLIIIALIDLFRQPTPNGPRWMWSVVILFVNLLGPIAYFLFGRKKKDENKNK
ncbi:PLD nuclease N-terminal domain-containing protein [Salsuginibacillus kocurii]|uniref:PLD nuclease N-terminal domain-containing protein n=1 Tax=Salsuginibacillus kocurii TaxID=427078 RepID=UPI00037F29D8|nr:PLD nuclease N-terminal domain-containing protein [Salsuginibacillus kocurii]